MTLGGRYLQGDHIERHDDRQYTDVRRELSVREVRGSREPVSDCHRFLGGESKDACGADSTEIERGMEDGSTVLCSRTAIAPAQCVKPHVTRGQGFKSSGRGLQIGLCRVLGLELP